MGMGRIKTIGGGKAKPVADSFNKFLLESLQNGDFASQLGVFTGDNNPLTAPTPVDMNDPQFAAAQSLFDQNNARNLVDLRSRFGAAGGAPRGSAAALAEALYRSDASSRNVLDINNIANTIREQNRADRVITSGELQFQKNQQMQALAQMFAAFQQANQLGTPQAQQVQQPSAFGQVLGAISGLAPYIAAPFTGGATLGIPAMGGYKPPVLRDGARTTITPQISFDRLPPLSYPG